MKYNYCPVCGEQLPKYHLGKTCKNCGKKEFKKKLIKTAVVVGAAAGIGTVAYLYVRSHKKEVAQTASKLASEVLALQMKRMSADQKILLDAARRAVRYRAD